MIIPFSTWGVFFAGLIVANGIAPEGEGLDTYIRSIPYMLYAWVAVLLVPLVISGIIPSLGPMKVAEERALNTGQVVPPDARHIEQAIATGFKRTSNVTTVTGVQVAVVTLLGALLEDPVTALGALAIVAAAVVVDAVPVVAPLNALVHNAIATARCKTAA